MSPRAGDGDSKGGHTKEQLFVVKASKTTKSLEIILSGTRPQNTHTASKQSPNLSDKGKSCVILTTRMKYTPSYNHTAEKQL